MYYEVIIIVRLIKLFIKLIITSEYSKNDSLFLNFM